MRIFSFSRFIIFIAVFISQLGQAQSVQGTDFWFMLPSNIDGGGNDPCNTNYRLILVSQFCIENSITLESPALGISNTYSIESGEYFEIDLSQLEGTFPQQVITPTPQFPDGQYTDASFHLSSPQPIQAFLFVDRGLSADGETLLPTEILGNQYVPVLRGFQINEVETHVVATEDNTTVQINGFGPVGQQTIVLDQGEIFSFLSREDCGGDVNFAGNCRTMDGTTIDSDKKVAVFASNSLAQMGSAGNGDMLMSTFLPVNQWSNEYYTGQNIERRALVGGNVNLMNGAGDYILITGAIGTEVVIESQNNPSRIETITAPAWGDYGFGYVFLDLVENGNYFGDANTYITADGPIQVTQYSKGSFSDSFQGSFDATKSDPEALLVLPSTLWQSSYIFYQIASREEIPRCFSGVSDFDELQTLTIIVDDVPINGQLPTENIELNGVNVGADEWIPFSPGSTKKIKRIVYGNTESTQVISTIGAKFGIYFYGSRERHSAIFSGGYGPIDNVNLCDQCADVDIAQGASACINESVPFSPVIYSSREPETVEFFWDFGDGTTSSDRNPVKTFNNTGVFTVSLRVSDSASDCELTESKEIFVNEVFTSIKTTDPDGVFCLGDSIFVFTQDSLQPEGRQRVQITNTDTILIPDGQSNTAGSDGGNVNSFGRYGQSIIDVQGNFQVGSFVDSICLNIQHPRVDELHGYLTTPWGERYDLFFDLSSNGRGNMRKTCFSPSAMVYMNDVEPPYSDAFREYSRLLGKPNMWDDITTREPVGEWVLNVGDNEEFNSGNITDWSLYINTENGVRTYDWEPKALLLDENASEASFTPPNEVGDFFISTTATTFNGCKTSDSLSFFRQREPISFPLVDTVLCSTSDSLVLDSIFSERFPEFVIGGTYTLLGNDPASVFIDDVFYPSRGTQQVYNIRYLYDFECGTDTAEILIGLNVLPELGPDSSTVLCNSFDEVNLNDFLVNDDENKGFWSSNPTLDSLQLDSATGIIRPVIIDTGSYISTYSVSLEACATVSVDVAVQINKQLSPGLFNDTIVCEQANGLNLLDLLNGNPDDGGVWTEANFNANVNNNVFNLRDRSNSGVETYDFTYSHLNQAPCLDTTANVVVRVSNAPRAELIPDLPIICADSTVEITVNIFGDSPTQGYDLTISDGQNTYPDVNTNVQSGVSFMARLANETTFKTLNLTDNSPQRCPSYETKDLVIPVFGQLFVDLVEERCEDDFSFFTPIINIRGGDSSAYFYELIVNGDTVKRNALVTSLPLIQDSIPNGSFYEYRFTDLSNCEDSRTSFKRFPPKYCECVTFPGTMSQDRIDLCEDVMALAPPTQGAFLETVAGSEDTLFYILHNTAGIVEGIIYDTNSVPEFQFDPSVLEYDVEYYISAVAGDKIEGFGYIDPLDTCVAINPGTPVVWRKKPTLDAIDAQAVVCFGETARIGYSASGRAPFSLDAQYQLDGGALRDTTLILPDNADSLAFNLPVSAQFTINRITDANGLSINNEGGMACFEDINQSFNIVINPLPEVTFAHGGDTLFGCEGDVLTANLLLTGQAPFQISYLLYGTRINTVTSDLVFGIEANQTGFIEILSVTDAVGCVGIIRGSRLTRTEFRKQPTAQILTNTRQVCGNTVELEALPSFGSGQWTVELGGTVSNDLEPITQGIANETDTALTFTWTESNPPCPASTDDIEVFFRLDPQPFAGKNDTVCGLQYTLQAEASIDINQGKRNWRQISNNDQASFNNSNIPNPIITVPSAGAYVFEYIESVDGICVNSDTVEILFVGEPEIIIVDTICDAVSENFTVVYEINSQLINQVSTNGTRFGSQYRISAASGEVLEIQATLNIACEPTASKEIAFSCPCISDADVIRSDTVKVCEKDVFSFVDVPNATLDANDTLVYVLKASADMSNLSDIIYSSGTNKYTFINPLITVGEIYYAMALVGNAKRSSTIGIDVNDRCLSATPPIPLIVQADVKLLFPNRLSYCTNENPGLEVVNIPNTGSYDISISVDGVLENQIVSSDDPFIDLNLTPGLHFVEIGQITSNDGFECASPNIRLVEVFVSEQPTISLDFKTDVCVGEPVSITLNNGESDYLIIINNEDTLRDKSNIYTFTESGVGSIEVSVMSELGCSATRRFNVNVEPLPTPNFQSLDNVCFGDIIRARVQGANPAVSDREWQVNGQSVAGNLLLTYTPPSKGSYTITLVESTANGCSASISKTITVNRPEADFDIGSDSICSNDDLLLRLFNPEDVASFSWSYSGYVNGNLTGNNVRVDLENGNVGNPSLNIQLNLLDSFGCTNQIGELVGIHLINANFLLGQENYCQFDRLNTSNISQNADEFVWEIGNAGEFRIFEIVNFPLNKVDSFDVKLTASNTENGCKDEVVVKLVVNENPEIEIKFDTICPNVSSILRLDGADFYQWTPAALLDNPNSSQPRIITTQDQEYIVVGTSNNGCTSTKEVNVPVHNAEPAPLLSFIETLNIQDTFRVSLPDLENYSYYWLDENSDTLCVNCKDSLFTLTNNVQLNILAESASGCFNQTYPVLLNVESNYTLDFPDAFTPNGDGINDFIRPDGLGIDEYITVQIFNRQGALLFDGGGESISWDGRYNGKVQSVGTYTYKVAVRYALTGEVEIITGTFEILQ